MDTLSQIRIWLLEYAVHKQYTSVISDHGPLLDSILQEDSSSTSCLHLRLLLHILQKVLLNNDKSLYELAVQLTKVLLDSEQDVVQAKTLIKILVSIQILVLFDMLQNKEDLVLGRLNTYFPRSGFSHPKADEKLSQKLTHAQVDFRSFFIPLIADRAKRCAYMAGSYNTEFGEGLLQRPQKLIRECAEKFSQAMPPTYIDRILEPATSKELSQKLEGTTGVLLKTFITSIQGQPSLSEDKVSELLGMFTSPLNQQQWYQELCREKQNNNLHFPQLDDSHESPDQQDKQQDTEESEEPAPQRALRAKRSHVPKAQMVQSSSEETEEESSDGNDLEDGRDDYYPNNTADNTLDSSMAEDDSPPVKGKTSNKQTSSRPSRQARIAKTKAAKSHDVDLQDIDDSKDLNLTLSESESPVLKKGKSKVKAVATPKSAEKGKVVIKMPQSNRKRQLNDAHTTPKYTQNTYLKNTNTTPKSAQKRKQKDTKATPKSSQKRQLKDTQVASKLAQKKPQKDAQVTPKSTQKRQPKNTHVMPKSATKKQAKVSSGETSENSENSNLKTPCTPKCQAAKVTPKFQNGRTPRSANKRLLLKAEVRVSRHDAETSQSPGSSDKENSTSEASQYAQVKPSSGRLQMISLSKSQDSNLSSQNSVNSSQESQHSQESEVSEIIISSDEPRKSSNDSSYKESVQNLQKTSGKSVIDLASLTKCSSLKPSSKTEKSKPVRRGRSLSSTKSLMKMRMRVKTTLESGRLNTRQTRSMTPRNRRQNSRESISSAGSLCPPRTPTPCSLSDYPMDHTGADHKLVESDSSTRGPTFKRHLDTGDEVPSKARAEERNTGTTSPITSPGSFYCDSTIEDNQNGENTEEEWMTCSIDESDDEVTLNISQLSAHKHISIVRHRSLHSLRDGSEGWQDGAEQPHRAIDRLDRAESGASPTLSNASSRRTRSYSKSQPQHSSEEFSDPDLLPSQTVVVPSSFSFDKFNTICGDSEELAKSALPRLEKHLKHPLIKPCIVKLEKLQI